MQPNEGAKNRGAAPTLAEWRRGHRMPFPERFAAHSALSKARGSRLMRGAVPFAGQPDDPQ